MNININSLIPIEEALNNTEDVFKIVDDIGKIVILKNNKPSYILLKYEENTEINNQSLAPKSALTLQDAMRIVLEEAEGKTLHASTLADIIFDRKLYLQKNGDKAKYNQLRARCGHYPDMFEALPGNYIKLKEKRK